MSNLSNFIGSSAPVGSIIQAPFNITDPNYLPCDGRVISRAAYPLLSACLPNIGVMTPTVRSKNIVNSSYNCAIATDGTTWVMGGDGGTNLATRTTDGITYTAIGQPSGSGSGLALAIIWTGVNFVALGSGGCNGYSPTGTTWTFSATAPTAYNTHSICFAPSLGTTGRLVACNNTGTPYTSDDHGVTWTVRSSPVTVFQVCWTGTRFVAVGNSTGTIVSTDGITWAREYPKNIHNNMSSITSDGAGKLCIYDANGNTVFTSFDNGVNWVQFIFSTPIGVLSAGILSGASIPYYASYGMPISYTNGKFFISLKFGSSAETALFASPDLISWISIPISQSLVAPYSSNGQGATISYKSGVYFYNQNILQVATFTEDLTLMQLPDSRQGDVSGTSGTAGSTISSHNNYRPFIKVK